MEIVVVKLGDVYHASLGGHSEIWETGQTSEEAIGKLIIFRGSTHFNITITNLKSKK